MVALSIVPLSIVQYP